MGVNDYTNREDRLNQLKIYYYFMLIDGNLSSEEEQRLEYICAEIDISEEERIKTIMQIDNRYHFIDADGSIDTNAVQTSARNLITRSDAFKYNNKLQLETFWNLLCLSLADKEVSKNESDFLSFVKEKWEIYDLVDCEFRDAAETLTALEDKLNWIQNAELEPDKQTQLIDRTFNQILVLIDGVQATIREETAPKNALLYDSCK